MHQQETLQAIIQVDLTLQVTILQAILQVEMHPAEMLTQQILETNYVAIYCL